MRVGIINFSFDIFFYSKFSYILENSLANQEKKPLNFNLIGIGIRCRTVGLGHWVIGTTLIGPKAIIEIKGFCCPYLLSAKL